MRVRHKELQRDMVVHSLPQPITAYELLCAVCCKQLPEIYDAVTLEDGQIVLEEYLDGLTVETIWQAYME